MADLNRLLLDYVWLVPIYSLVGAALTLPWSLGLIYRTGARPAAYINILMTILALVHSSLVLNLSFGQPLRQLSFTWLQVYDFDLTMTLDISVISSGAAVLICTISLLAQIYALGSMETDWAIARFYGLMGFFEAALSGIAISDSLFLSYVLLELLTLSTYLLVGFWYAQPLVITAARDAFWTKRVGDLFLLMSVVALSTLTGSLNFTDLEVWAKSPDTLAFFTANPQYAFWLGMGLIAGPTGKCAQFPLHLWLDEAMEGPNPASVLRNSVVVSSGAYILIKLAPVLALSPWALSALVIIGTITGIGAALVAIAQIDLKRALSHTTSAHLGLVFIAVGMEQQEVALGFLFTHAIARALLFMSTGAVMMTTMTQDLGEMGGLWSKMPATTIGFLVGAFGLLGLLPLGNFWTMLDWIEHFWGSSPVLVAILLIVNALIAFGFTRVFALVFLGKVTPKTRRAPEVGWQVAVPIVALIVLVLLVPLMLWNFSLWQPEKVFNWAAIALLVSSGALGCGLGASTYILNNYAQGSTVPLPPRPVSLLWRSIQSLLARDLLVIDLYRATVVALVSLTSQAIAWLDRVVIDGAVNFVGTAAVFSSNQLKYTVTGQSQQYVLTIVIGMIVVGVLAFFSLP